MLKQKTQLGTWISGVLVVLFALGVLAIIIAMIWQ